MYKDSYWYYLLPVFWIISTSLMRTCHYRINEYCIIVLYCISINSSLGSNVILHQMPSMGSSLSCCPAYSVQRIANASKCTIVSSLWTQRNLPTIPNATKCCGISVSRCWKCWMFSGTTLLYRKKRKVVVAATEWLSTCVCPWSCVASLAKLLRYLNAGGLTESPCIIIEHSSP